MQPMTRSVQIWGGLVYHLLLNPVTNKPRSVFPVLPHVQQGHFRYLQSTEHEPCSSYQSNHVS